MMERTASGHRKRCAGAAGALLALASLLGGCSAFSGFTDSLFGGETSPAEPAQQAEAVGAVKPSAYYVAEAGLPLYAEPGRTVIARLERYQKVVRSRLVGGYAFVKVDGTGQEGWLDNAKLIWRLPAKDGSPAAAEPAPQPPSAPPPVGAVPQPDAAQPPPAAMPSPDTETEPATAPTPTVVSPDIFEPF